MAADEYAWTFKEYILSGYDEELDGTYYILESDFNALENGLIQDLRVVYRLKDDCDKNTDNFPLNSVFMDNPYFLMSFSIDVLETLVGKSLIEGRTKKAEILHCQREKAKRKLNNMFYPKKTSQKHL